MSWGRKPWISKVDAALEFIRTGSLAYNLVPVAGAARVGCIDSSNCGSGWRCQKGYCVPDDGRGGGSGGDGCGGGGGGENPCPPGGGGGASSRGGVGGCNKAGCGGRSGGGGGNADDCCGQGRCCRIGNGFVQCFCGDCPDPPGCDVFCSGYQAANGEKAPGCGDNGCDECSSCVDQGNLQGGKCEPISNGPCWCEKSACRDCEKCYAPTLGAVTAAPSAGVNGTYENIPTDSTSGSGEGLTVDLTIQNSGVATTDYILTLTSYGSGYTGSDTLTIADGTLAGLGAIDSGAGDLVFSFSDIVPDAEIGTCVKDCTTCKTCVTMYNHPCPCGYATLKCCWNACNGTPDYTKCALEGCAKAGLDGDCDCEDCTSVSMCYGLPCPDGYAQKGEVCVGDDCCLICEKCEPSSRCGCSSHAECPDCFLCGADGECYPDPECEELNCCSPSQLENGWRCLHTWDHAIRRKSDGGLWRYYRISSPSITFSRNPNNFMYASYTTEIARTGGISFCHVPTETYYGSTGIAADSWDNYYVEVEDLGEICYNKCS